jgi:hypothetical protein
VPRLRIVLGPRDKVHHNLAAVETASIRKSNGFLHQSCNRTTKPITSRAMNDEKKFSASTPIVPKSAGGTPPDRQIPLLLTPPATDDLQSTSIPQSPVSAVLDLIKQHQCHKPTAQSRRLQVKPLDYEILLARLEELPELKAFVDDKLRYATIWIGVLVEISS